MINHRAEIFLKEAQRDDLAKLFHSNFGVETTISSGKGFLFQSEEGITSELVEKYFLDPVLEELSMSEEGSQSLLPDCEFVVEIGFLLAGVTDNTARSAMDALSHEQWKGSMDSDSYTFLREQGRSRRFESSKSSSRAWAS